MEGDLRVKSKDGKGSSFCFTCRARLAIPEESSVSQQLKPHHHLKVLFIDKGLVGYEKERIRALTEIGLASGQSSEREYM